MDQGYERRTSDQRGDGLQLERRDGNLRGRVAVVCHRTNQGSGLLREEPRGGDGDVYARDSARRGAQFAERGGFDIRGRRYLWREKGGVSRQGAVEDRAENVSRGSDLAAVRLHQHAARA